jgi:two-component system, NtrC family, sensor kinase
MKKLVYVFCLFLGDFGVVHGQNEHLLHIDKLKREITSIDNDTIHMILLGQIANTFSEIYPDSAYVYAEKMLVQSQDLNLRLEEAGALGEMGYAQINLGNYPRSLQHFLAAIAITSDPKNETPKLSKKFAAVEEFTDRTQPAHIQRLVKLSRIYQYTGILYGNSGNYEKALFYYRNSLDLAVEINNLKLQCITQITLGRTYHSLGQLDSALISLQSALASASESHYERYLGSILLNTGRVYESMGNRVLAKEFFKRAIKESLEQEYFRGVVAANLALSDLFKQSGESDSSFYYINDGLNYMDFLNAPDLYIRSFSALTDYYKSLNNSDSALKYQSFIINISDSLFNAKQIQQFQNIDFDEVQRQRQLEEAETAYRNKVIKKSLLAGLGVLLLIAIFQFRNNGQKQKAKQKIEKAYDQLKSTQSQLIQSEKMASLGELTAGIAHEIQNPLNFVNNFSEVSKEMIEELKAERQKVKGERDEVLEGELLHDINENLGKIHHHGQRASDIVKSMLQHSRTSSGQKEPTDINALADEYLRLAYHGFRAKDKSFNADFKADLDPSLPKVSVIPQDIGRVLLNLINNAFYAVSSKALATEDSSFQPQVVVKTKKHDNLIEIKVKDNGNGIPDDIVNKIFQPFFTTKPTGQGTGLGLSLSYDIITKGHNGSLEVDTTVGLGSEFIIQLPIV